MRQLQGENSNNYKTYQNKEEFLHMVHTWFDEPDVGMASIAWDMLALERGEDSL